jgi:hypothetical protein
MPCTRPSPRRLAEAAIRRALSLCVGSALLILAACGPERAVEPAPTEPVPGPDLRAQAFKLTIDTRSGRIDVAPPARATASVDGLALSLLGGDAIALSTGACVFSAIPDRSKKRCTMNLSIGNLLSAADLVSPTTFPRPPQGTSGILVFPFTATTPAGGEVAPSPDWDLGPVNFFNDNTCSGADKTDCYRYELFPSPLYALESTPARQVGFDIPASASSVTVYLVVAADLRDNPVLTRMLTAVPELCGDVNLDLVPPLVQVAHEYLWVSSTRIGFCSFPNKLPAGARIHSASIRLFTDILAEAEAVVVQRVNWGPVLEPSDVLLPTLNTVGRLLVEDEAYRGGGWKWVAAAGAGSAVQGAVNEQQTLIQFRLIQDRDAGAGGDPFITTFVGTGGPTGQHPKLVVHYTLP